MSCEEKEGKRKLLEGTGGSVDLVVCVRIKMERGKEMVRRKEHVTSR